MLDAIKPLLDSDLITEDTRREITEAWEAKLAETREQVRVELREEFAQRYEHDRSVMVEALDRMVTEGLTAEIEQVKAERQALAEDRVKFQVKMSESANRFNSFLVTKLAEEITELRKDRQVHNQSLEKLEEFVVHALAREIQEFAQDKREVVDTKVRLVREARVKLNSLKARFVKESAAKLSTSVSQHLKRELTQLHEDIQTARENNFGRRIFEAYAAEFSATHLNEKSEMRRLRDLVSHKDRQLAEAIGLSERARTLIEHKERELRMVKENRQRQDLISDLVRPLNQDKAEVMRNLLESVQTDRLKNAFEKYLPAVLEDRSTRARQVIAEQVRAVTGDKTVPSSQQVESDAVSNVIDLKRLAGL